ncbi:hypothetical protein SUDANB145_02227 [Streptomyces sp. enrichment culture]|uniref:CHAT domain-containing protein n=1 Tax=Streptomyces sp. enrichment culture TaxID=1795815 RepID=UPI003F54FE48
MTFRHARDQAAIDAVVTLVREIHAGHLSEEAATERMRDPQRKLTKKQALTLVNIGYQQVRAGVPSSGYLLARLVLAASDVRWGRGRTSPWWGAADLLVEATRIDLVARPSAARLQLACSVADEQIATLRKEGDLEELAETMYAAGILRVHPHIGRPLVRDDPTVQNERHVRAAVRSSLFASLDAWSSEEDGLVPDLLPSPVDAALEALPYLYGAVGLSSGHLRGRCLNSVNEALALLMREPDARYWLSAAALANSRSTARLLDRKRDPVNWVRSRRILAEYDGETPGATLDEVLPMPLPDLVRMVGERETWAVADQALCLLREARSREGLRALVDAVHTHIPVPPDPECYRETWESHLHVLPDDPQPCPDSEAGTGATEDLFSRMTDDPARSLPTMLHLAAHLYHQTDPRVIAPLLTGGALHEEITGFSQKQPKQIQAAIRHLLGNAAARAGTTHRKSAEYRDSVSRHAEATTHYMAIGLRDLALRELEFMAECAAEGSTEDAIYAAFLFRLAVVPQLDSALFEDTALALYVTAQRIGALLAGPVGEARAFMSLEVAAKGFDFSRALANTGPRHPVENLTKLVHRIDKLEKRLGVSALPRLEELGEDLEMLCYAGSQERAPGTVDEELLSNLRRSFDRQLSRSLYRRGEGAAPSVSPALDLDDVLAALPSDTVLVSLFMGIEPEGSADAASKARNSVAIYVTTVTQEGLQDARVRRTGEPGAVLRLARGGYSHAVHPLAYEVEAVRSAVRTDPLHREVAREAVKYLSIERIFGKLGDVLSQLHAEGKRHLCFWAHGPFHFLPFPLLHVNGQPLADQWTVTTVPSLACITDATKRHAGHGLVSVGAGLGGTRWRLAPEPALDKHAAVVAQHAGGIELIGPKATPNSLLELTAGARYVHVAAHGSHSQEAPWFQCLYLNPPEDGSDGRLFAHEVLRADLRSVDLVTLSACESGLGRFDITDNLRGLPAAFLLAGARAVVGCLWPVRTEVATFFFSELHRDLASHHNTLGAFRHAQTVTREQFRQYQDWGTFIYHGGWSRPDQRIS